MGSGDAEVEGSEVLAMDGFGNPVCRHCGAGAIVWAALGNGGSRKQCWCPTDPRTTDVKDRNEAVTRILDALDLLERLDHSLTCRCPACEAKHALLGGVVVGGAIR